MTQKEKTNVAYLHTALGDCKEQLFFIIEAKHGIPIFCETVRCGTGLNILTIYSKSSCDHFTHQMFLCIVLRL